MSLGAIVTVFASIIALIVLARIFPGTHWVRILFQPHEPRTEVHYLTRAELFRSGIAFIGFRVILAAL